LPFPALLSRHGPAPGPRDRPWPGPRAHWHEIVRVVFLIALSSSLVARVPSAGEPGPDPEPRPESARPVPAQSTPQGPPVPLSKEFEPSRPTRPILDPAARLLEGDHATESWTVFVDLDSGHRITQRFLLSNAGPGRHNAVAVGHLTEPGRAPYRYANGRRRSRWTLSPDRLFFDIAASHLDLHRPEGEVRISKDDIELRVLFDLSPSAPTAAVPTALLPEGYRVDVLALGVDAQATLKAPWMDQALSTRGRAWVVHTSSEIEEAHLVDRRVELFSRLDQGSFYAIQLSGPDDWESAWAVQSIADQQIIESTINLESTPAVSEREESSAYALPERFEMDSANASGLITLNREWLRFDPLDVLPQPFRWFVRRRSRPLEVWADVQIRGSLSLVPGTPSLPDTGETTSAGRVMKTSRKQRPRRETEHEAARSSETGVASITFLNPTRRR